MSVFETMAIVLLTSIFVVFAFHLVVRRLTMTEQDTREQLEADIDCYRAEDCPDYLRVPVYRVHSWLDRQAAIVRAEVFEDGEYDCMTCAAKAELQEQVDTLTAERDKWMARAVQVHESYLDAKDSRDNLQAAIDAMENGQFYAMYRQVCRERDDLAERLDDAERTNAELFRDNSLLRSTIAELGVKVDELTTERDELKPCNYCKDGGEPKIVNDGFFYVVGCHECGYTTGAYYTKESAIAAWNARADDVPKQPVDNAQADSREQLEAEVKSYMHLPYNNWRRNDYNHVIEWLDRQAEITEREVEHDLMLAGRMAVEVERKRIAELTAERDDLKHDNSLLQSTIAELGLKVDEKQAELLEARASCKADPVEIQLALARFADEWTTTDTRAQEQRLITYYAQHIANDATASSD